jgi:hypothetical protein
MNEIEFAEEWLKDNGELDLETKTITYKYKDIEDMLEASKLYKKEDTINPKMLLSKEDLFTEYVKALVNERELEEEKADLKEKVKEHYSGVKNHHELVRKIYDAKDNRIPDYYIGNNGYEARKVVDGFELSYNVGTAVTYLLRAERKHDTPIDCIQKAINHLEFELDKLKEKL